VEFSLEAGIQVLRRTPQVLQSMLIGLGEGWISGDEGAGSWSPWQVAAHLTHIDETDWVDRTQAILTHGTTRAFDPVDREAGFARFSGWSIGKVLDRFASVRAGNLETLDRLVRASDLGRLGLHPVFGEVTLSQLLATWVVHDLNHLGQIVKAMARQYGDAVGPWRELLGILNDPAEVKRPTGS
jgi:uncharacterized damage-inducible protein DinB